MTPRTATLEAPIDLRQTRRVQVMEWAAALLAMGAALVINHRAGTFVNGIGPSLAPAYDLLFQYLPFGNFPIIHVWGFVGFLVVFGAGVLFTEPRGRVPFIMWTYALLVTTRAVFNVLTPLGLPAEAPHFHDYPIQGIVSHLDFRHTLFFSGHTAFPFMGFLLLRSTPLRFACLGFSAMLATTVLLSRLHYSIDVAAAFFIAYSVLKLAESSWSTLRRGLCALAD